MTAILNQKSEFISSLLLNKEKDDKLFREFIGNFYKNASLGYLLNITEQSSKNIILKIAEHVFEIFQKQPPENDFHISHHLFENHGHQVLFLHCFNKPFIVRSLNVWIVANKLNVDEFIHSIFTPQRSENITHCFGGANEELVIAIILPISTKIPDDYSVKFHAIYHQITLAVDDYLPMQNEIKRITSTLLGQTNEYLQQVGSLLKWLENKHFAFLGIRNFTATTSKHVDFSHQATQRLGTFKLNIANECEEFFPQILKMQETQENLYNNHLLQIRKTNKRSDIYRGSRLDSIKVLDIDSNGAIVGIVQIIGLFTSDFYKASPLHVPGLQSKVIKIYQHFGFTKHSHNGRILKNIIDSIPLDEFYYLPKADLIGLVARILNMYDRTVVFARNDHVANAVSVLVYIPKYRYSEKLRQELGKYLINEFGGTLTSTHGNVGDATFARLIYIINCDSFTHTPTDIEQLEEKLWIASQTWQERFNYCCKRTNISNNITFSDLYINLTKPAVAASDTAIILDWLKTEENVYFEIINKENKVIVRIFQRNDPLTLGQIIPIFNNFQLHIQSEITFFADIDSQKIWMHYYEISDLNDLLFTEQTIGKLLEGLKAAWNKTIEVDPFNALTIACDLNFNEIIIFRALGRFLKQLDFNYSQKALADCLGTYPTITQSLIEFFKNKFDLHNQSYSELPLENFYEKIIQSFSVIKRLDHDRIMRRILNIMVATLRTNAYQSGVLKPYPCVSFKVNSTQIIDIPKPSPLFEIFVYSPDMEGCHLRGGTIARGGIRWSDRPEDFRSETLGLMKAQMVKNSVIVPVGSKGGFFVKNYNALQESGADNNQLKEIVVSSYQSFISQLLSLTDNLVAKEIVSPVNVLKYDSEDPYLVVAADKGTATFSDIANEISQSVNFWLGDAFASGGSNGYDHKKLAITARGAWIAVRRHFWELGIDCQTTPISVIGVGDMAGDVFGNAMLQSAKIKLLAAFNHKHIFLDPTPDAEQSYNERNRLFDLPTSNWNDYNPAVISKGGGVFERSAKIIEISPEVATMLNINKPQLTPDELITKILLAQVDLLFFGGIGTFVKGHQESNTQVADRANDAIRVEARMVRAKIIGEGANLGLTQLGRVEYALRGGRINMDAIDNSAGVDCSDHEVNLKIMCQVLLEQNLIDNNGRDKLLRSLADEVSELVLEDNWLQTLILTLMQEESRLDLNSYNPNSGLDC